HSLDRIQDARGGDELVRPAEVQMGLGRQPRDPPLGQSAVQRLDLTSKSCYLVRRERLDRIQVPLRLVLLYRLARERNRHDRALLTCHPVDPELPSACGGHLNLLSVSAQSPVNRSDGTLLSEQ